MTKVESIVRLFCLTIFGFSWCLLGGQTVAAAPLGTIAFLSSRDSKPPRVGAHTTVYLINADGTNERKWLENPQASFGPITWSPNGKHVVFHMQTDINIHIFLMNVLTKERKNMTEHFGGRQYLSPQWSPDGKWLALSDIVPNAMGDWSDIYIMDIKDNQLKRLIQHPRSDHVGSWSPDSSKIVFSFNRDGNGEIYVMDSNGGNQINLSNHPTDEFMPKWSPDGKKIAFCTDRKAGAQYEIFVMDADGTNVVNLTRHPWHDLAPAWSPNGEWIAFQSFKKGRQSDIYVMEANGDNRTQLTAHPSSDARPTWVIPDWSLPVDTRGNHVTFWGRIKSDKQ